MLIGVAIVFWNYILINPLHVSAQNNHACFYNQTDPNCISLVQCALGLTRAQALRKIAHVRALLDEPDAGGLLFDKYSPFLPIDVVVACLASGQVPYDSQCYPCDQCPFYYSFGGRVCTLFCPAKTTAKAPGAKSSPSPAPILTSVTDFISNSASSSSIIQLPTEVYILFIGLVAIAIGLSLAGVVYYIYQSCCMCSLVPLFLFCSSLSIRAISLNLGLLMRRSKARAERSRAPARSRSGPGGGDRVS